MKCSEEKPVCQNCVKSKKECEGYHKNVVFKEPLLPSDGAAMSFASYSGESSKRIGRRRSKGSQTAVRSTVPESTSVHPERNIDYIIDAAGSLLRPDGVEISLSSRTVDETQVASTDKRNLLKAHRFGPLPIDHQRFSPAASSHQAPGDLDCTFLVSHTV